MGPESWGAHLPREGLDEHGRNRAKHQPVAVAQDEQRQPGKLSAAAGVKCRRLSVPRLCRRGIRPAADEGGISRAGRSTTHRLQGVQALKAGGPQRTVAQQALARICASASSWPEQPRVAPRMASAETAASVRRCAWIAMRHASRREGRGRTR